MLHSDTRKEPGDLDEGFHFIAEKPDHWQMLVHLLLEAPEWKPWLQKLPYVKQTRLSETHLSSESSWGDQG